MDGSWPSIMVVGVFAAALTYHFVVRPWHSNWGTTGDEATRRLPGDDFASAHGQRTTHVVGINAAAKEVWPWIVQIGQQRGGFYSYTWLENLVGCQMKNANKIVPEWQRREVGDDVWLHPQASPLKVVALEPERFLVLGLRRERSAFSWAFVIEERSDTNTRLIARGKGRWGLGWIENVLNYFIGEPAHFIMERKMLLGIKHRVESMCHSSITRRLSE
jgi:hypothetical protein